MAKIEIKFTLTIPDENNTHAVAKDVVENLDSMEAWQVFGDAEPYNDDNTFISDISAKVLDK